MRALVTGGAGLIGSHLCDVLLSRGHEVVSVDDLSAGSTDNCEVAQSYDNFTFLPANVCDESLASAITGADVVVHLAAKKIPRYGNRIDTLLANLNSTQSAFELAAKFGAKIVFTSTSDIYGRNKKVPLTEEDEAILPGPEIARWAYATSKYCGEHLLFSYAEKYDLPLVCMRLFATFGPRQHRSWWGGPTPVFIERACRNEVIPIHGDGEQTRSFCFVEDTVDGIARCVEMEEANGEVFNIGNPGSISIKDYARLVAETVAPDRPPRFEFIPYSSFAAYEDIPHRVPDIGKIQRLLGYAPKVSIAEGVQRTVKWQRPFHE